MSEGSKGRGVPMSRRKTLALAAFLILVAQASGNSQLDQEPLLIEYTPPRLTLRIHGQTNLLAALEGICQRTAARCELAPAVADIELGSMVAEGTWEQVITKLLQGTKLDYGYVAPTPEGAGILLVEKHNASGELPREEKSTQRTESQPADAAPNSEGRSIDARIDYPGGGVTF